MRGIVFSAATVAACGLSTFAAAQPDRLNLDLTGLTLRGGVMLPIDSALTDAGSVFFNIGFDWELQPGFFRPGTALAIDFLFPSTRFQDNIIALAFQQRFFQPMDAAGLRRYFFVGLGAAHVDIGRADIVLLGKAGFGVEVSPRTVVEATLFVSDRTRGGVNVNALMGSIGYRF
jgi:hypothetical protein